MSAANYETIQMMAASGAQTATFTSLTTSRPEPTPPILQLCFDPAPPLSP